MTTARSVSENRPWRIAKLGDVCEKITDGTHHSPPNGQKGDFKYITAKNIKPSGLDLTDITYVDTATHREIYSRCDVRKDDILYVKDGATTGRVALNTLEEEFSLLSSVGVLRPNREYVLPKYLLYVLQAPTVKDRMLADVAGVAITRLTLKKLKAAEIPLAPLEQQGYIIAELEKQFSRLDEAVANLKRVNANLKRYKAAVLKAAFEGRLVPTEAELARREGHGYESGQALLRRVAEIRRLHRMGKAIYEDPPQPDSTELPELPEGWAWARLETLASLKGGITVDKKRKDPTSRSVPYLRVANVQRGHLDLAEIKMIHAPEADIEELRLRHGDILFNEGGDRDKLGRGWVWEDQLPECIHQNHVFRARLHSHELSAKLISWWGNTFGRDYFLREGKQTTNLASINMTKLSALPVTVPPAGEQRRIEDEVEKQLSLLNECLEVTESGLRRATRLHSAVLSRAFEGGHED